jgi:hypothetical protein
MQMKRNLPFLQRLCRQAIYWGIPMVCLDLIGVPLFGWGTVLATAVPATLVAITVGALLEPFLASAQPKLNKSTEGGPGIAG